jgi:hypothetical protein
MRIRGTQHVGTAEVNYDSKNNPERIHMFSTNTRNDTVKNMLHLVAHIAMHTIHTPNNNSSLYI